MLVRSLIQRTIQVAVNYMVKLSTATRHLAFFGRLRTSLEMPLRPTLTRSSTRLVNTSSTQARSTPPV